MGARQHFCRCGTRLAKDNPGRLCARCQRLSRNGQAAPPEVPVEFWETEQFREAFAAQHMGWVCRAYRTHPHHHAAYGPRGISQTLLGQWLGLLQSQVSEFETGPPVLHLDTLRRWANTLRIPAELLWFDMPGQPSRLVARDRCEPRDGMSDGSANVPDGASLLVAPSQSDRELLLTAPPEQVIAYLQDQWHLLVRADNLFGPARVLRLVHAQIDLIESLLRHAPESLRTALLSLGAEYAESAAWLHEDAGEQIAIFWTGRALEWAHAAEDHRLVAWALFRRSQQVSAQRHAAQTIALARAADGMGSRLSNQMRAAVTQQEAYGLALDRDEASCQRTLDKALEWAASDDIYGDARSGHGAFCTASYIELRRAECWQVLGRPERAVPACQAALAGLPAAYNRDRGHGLAQLADALVALDEPEYAASVASEALTIAHGCGSGRTLRRIHTVGGKLRRHAKLSAVAQLLDDIAVASP